MTLLPLTVVFRYRATRTVQRKKISMVPCKNMKSTGYCLVLVGIWSLCAMGICFGSSPTLVQAASTGQIFTMASTTSWNIRFDGPADQIGGLTPAFGYYNVLAQDYDGDGKVDLIVGGRRLDPLGRQDAGSLFFIKHDLFASSTGTGNIIDLSSAANYNLRIDGVAAGDEGQRSPQLGDFDNDGKVDLAFNAYRQDSNSTDSGSIYLLNNDKFANYTTTGNTLDLASSTSWNIRIDGRTGAQLVSVRVADVNNDGKLDLGTGEFGTPTVEGVRRLFILFDNIFDPYLSSTGNIISLASSTSYTASYRDQRAAAIQTADIDMFQDMNNDGKSDLLVSSLATDANPAVAGLEGSVYIIKNDILTAFGTSTGNDINFASSSSAFSLRIDGPNGNSGLGVATGVDAGDLDGDGLPELLLTTALSNNGRSNSYSVYLMSGTAINSYGSTSTGNSLSLSNTSNYLARFDGAAAGDKLGANAPIRIADLDNDGKNDLFISAASAVSSASHPGHVYEFFNSSLTPYLSSTGNTIDLASTSPAIWNIRYDGAVNGDWLGAGALQLVDINSDGQKDILVSAWGASIHGSQSGSVYLILYFPHTLTLDPIFTHAGTTAFDVTGLVSAPNNTTSIEAVEWGHERSFGDSSGDFLKTWHTCLPRDGAFDSNSEAFVCHHEALDIDANHASPHQVFFRARDSKGIYTAVANYPTETYTHESALSAPAVLSAALTTTISFTTEAAATSTFEWGTTASYGLSTSTAATSTSHSFTVPITACTLYYYRATAYDVAGNHQAATGSFTSVGCPQISTGGGGGGNGPIFGTIIAATVPFSPPTATPSVPPVLPQPAFCPVFFKNLKRGMSDPQVSRAQTFLRKENLFTYPSTTTYFGSVTEAAVRSYQLLHKDQVLAPLNLSKPTGLWYERTRGAANAEVGC
jgi:hypothetical protein